jgi:hypothetical protein
MIAAVRSAEALTSCCKYYRAIFDTGTAAGTAILDDTAGPFSDLNLEISRRSFHGFQISESDELDV